MKHLKKIVVIGAVVLALGATSVTALAASGYTTPAEIVAGLTGKSVEAVTAEKTETGETYGSIADENGVLDEFHAQMTEQKKARLEERVTAGTMTREQADAIIAAMAEHQADCDGTCDGTGGGAGIGAGTGAMFGSMSGNHGGGGRSGSGSARGTCTADA